MTAKNTSIPTGDIILRILAILGLILIVYRFAVGLGGVTNLSDDFPWGLWVGIDILAGIALASGGFVMAGVVHFLGGRKYEELYRLSILTALLGYIMFLCGLIVDLGRPWNLLHIIFTGNHSSPLYEVGWCVMLYTVILILEFLPFVFEKYGMKKAFDTWRSLSPALAILMLAVFMFAMTRSWTWTLLILGIALAWEICVRMKIMPGDKRMPVLLIIAGVIFPTLHQASLGSLYLMMPHELHALWYSPLLPLLFLLSAIMVAPAMVIFEAISSHKFLGHGINFDLLKSLAKVMPYLLISYLAVMITGMVVQGTIYEAFKVNGHALSWWLEIIAGILIPLRLFLSKGYSDTNEGLFTASLLVIFGVVWNRINISLIGIAAGSSENYHPYWCEILITVGIISAGLLVFKRVRSYLPV